MARIRYSIRIRIVKHRMLSHDTKEQTTVASRSLRLRILPAKDEEPPMDIAEDDENYSLRKEKDVKKGLLKLGKTGRLTAEAVQPRSLQLHPLRSTDTSPVTTSTTVNLRFDPACPDQQPPPLESCSSKLRISTYYAATDFPWIPRRKGTNVWDTFRGSYSEPLDLSSRCISTVQWERHEPTANGSPLTALRHESTSSARSAVSNSSSQTPLPSQSYTEGSPFYIARVSVPLSLPSNKVFVPTFHTCLISRLYTLEVSVSWSPSPSSRGKGKGKSRAKVNPYLIAPHLTLKIPIDIAAKGNPDARPSISDAEAAAIAAREAMMEDLDMTDADIFRLLEPRSSTSTTTALMEIPSPAYEERAPIADLGRRVGRNHSEEGQAPPGYSHSTFGGMLRGGGLGLQASAQVMC